MVKYPESWTIEPQYASRSDLVNQRKTQTRAQVLLTEKGQPMKNAVTTALLARSGKDVSLCLTPFPFQSSSTKPPRCKSLLLQERRQRSIEEGEKFPHSPEKNIRITSRPPPIVPYVTSSRFALAYVEKPNIQSRNVLLKERKDTNRQKLQDACSEHEVLQKTLLAEKQVHDENIKTKTVVVDPLCTRSGMISNRRANFTAQSAKFEPKKEPGVHVIPPPSFSQQLQDGTMWWEVSDSYVKNPILKQHVKNSNNILDLGTKRLSTLDEMMLAKSKKLSIAVDVVKYNPHKHPSYSPATMCSTSRFSNEVLERRNKKSVFNTTDAFKYDHTCEEPYYSGFSPDHIFMSNTGSSQLPKSSKTYKKSTSTFTTYIPPRPLLYTIDYSNKAKCALLSKTKAKRRALGLPLARN